MVEVCKEKSGRFAKTFPAGWPLLTLDRIYVKNVKVIESKVWVHLPHRHFSDHLPLYCEVEIET